MDPCLTDAVQLLMQLVDIRDIDFAGLSHVNIPLINNATIPLQCYVTAITCAYYDPAKNLVSL